MKKELVLLVIAFVLGVGILGYKYFFPMTPEQTTGTQSSLSTEIPSGATVITLSKDGFSPDEISIRVGDTVAFRSTVGELFWPASNLHPSHLIYPEFDPQEPLQSNEVWSFTFTKPGEWKYHDHLAPYYTGVITVTE